eukprot:Em0005g943a
MEICASTEVEWESGNVDTGGSSTVTESHSPSAIASDELSLAIGDEDIGHLDEAEKDSESSSDSAHTQAERKRLRTLYGTSEKENHVNHLLQLPVDLHQDFKFLAQIAMFIFSPYLFEAEIEVWLALSMVFKMVYCDEFEPQKIELYRDVCHRFARAIDCYSVTWRKKLKIHLILHLPDSMLRFGPASSFNTERCGEDLVNLYHTKEVQAFLGGEVQERGSGIHKHGTLRKCSARTKAPLASVPITLEGKTMSLEEIDAKFTVLLPHGISNLTPVQWGRATVGKNGQLINVQDYIEYNSQASTSVGLETGLFIGSFHTEQATFCLHQHLSAVQSLSYTSVTTNVSWQNRRQHLGLNEYW